MLLGQGKYEFLKGRDLLFLVGDSVALVFACVELRLVHFLWMWITGKISATNAREDRHAMDSTDLPMDTESNTATVEPHIRMQFAQFKRRMIGSLFLTVLSILVLSNITFGG